MHCSQKHIQVNDLKLLDKTITILDCMTDNETLTIAIKQSLKITAIGDYHFLANILKVSNVIKSDK